MITKTDAPDHPEPLERLVCLVFREEAVEEFLSLFAKVREAIRQQPGCLYLALWQDRTDPRVILTFSQWTGPEALENYKQTLLFKDTWARTKSLFEEPPQAWSLRELDRLP
jgi:quinol monooxygenase YgiN